MIVIYEKDDLVEGVIDRPMFIAPGWADVDTDLHSASFGAETVYIARQDGRFPNGESTECAARSISRAN